MAKRLSLKDGDLVPNLPEGWVVRVVEDKEKVRRVSREMAGKRIYLIAERPRWAWRPNCEKYATSLAGLADVIRSAGRYRDEKLEADAGMRAAARERLAQLRELEGAGHDAEWAEAEAARTLTHAETLEAEARALRLRALLFDEFATFQRAGTVKGLVRKPWGSRAESFTLADLEGGV